MTFIETEFDPLGDGKSKLKLIKFFGGDLDVVNDAKASFARQATELTEREERLIRHLISPITEPQHTSPLRGTAFKFQVKCPLFVARQWWKHHIASSHTEEQDGWNEQSFRYMEISEDGDFYIPTEFKKQHALNKQASGEPLSNYDQNYLINRWKQVCNESLHNYRSFLDCGVSREQARGLLVPAFYTSFRWTVSLQALLNFIDLREGHGAQHEIAEYAEHLKYIVVHLCPHTYSVWTARKNRIKQAMQLLEDYEKGYYTRNDKEG